MFIDLEKKAYDRVPTGALWRCSEAKGGLAAYIRGRLDKNMKYLQLIEDRTLDGGI